MNYFYIIYYFYILLNGEVVQSVPLNRGKIVGGSNTTIKYFPYQVQLYIDRYFCGGSIISSKWVLTAGHCVDGAQTIIVRAGSTYYNQGGLIFYGSEWKRHPSFNSETLDYDMALIKINTSFPLGTANISSIKLASSQPVVGKSLLVSGWGSYSYYNGPQPSILKFLWQSVISRTACDRYFYPVTTRMMCAFASGNSVCSGDSGGPLVDYTYKVQYGIVSFGDKCTTKTPDAYTNVATLRSWITQISGV